MIINFIRGKFNPHRLSPMTAIVCPTDSNLSGTGSLEKVIREAAGPGLAACLAGKHLKSGETLVTEGYNLAHNPIIHAPVPPVSQAASDPQCLRKVYNSILRVPNTFQHGPVTAIITHIVTPLLGTGAAGWTYETSMDALWQEILALQPRSVDYRLQVLDIYYPEEAQSIVESYRYRTSQAFFSNITACSTPGESRLWLDLMGHFDDPKFNRITPEKFVEEIQRFYHNKAGRWLCGNLNVYVKTMPYAANLPNGHISHLFTKRTIPVLVSNLVKLGLYPTNSDTFLIPVTLPASYGEAHQLTLPYELLPLLTHLRSDDYKMNDSIRYSLDFENLYYLTIHHHKYLPDLISHYSLDVEDAHDRHYTFSEAAAQALVRHFHEHPKALIRGMIDYLKRYGGPALESLVRTIASGTHSY